MTHSCIHKLQHVCMISFLVIEYTDRDVNDLYHLNLNSLMIYLRLFECKISLAWVIIFHFVYVLLFRFHFEYVFKTNSLLYTIRHLLLRCIYKQLLQKEFILFLFYDFFLLLGVQHFLYFLYNSKPIILLNLWITLFLFMFISNIHDLNFEFVKKVTINEFYFLIINNDDWFLRIFKEMSEYTLSC